MGGELMVRCKEASTVVATSQPPATWSRRMAVRIHLAVCPHCRAFRRQVEAIGDLGRASAQAFEREPSADFEAELTRRLRE